MQKENLTVFSSYRLRLTTMAYAAGIFRTSVKSGETGNNGIHGYWISRIYIIFAILSFYTIDF